MHAMPAVAIHVERQAGYFASRNPPALDLRVLRESPPLKKEVCIRRQAVLDLIKAQTAPMSTKEMARALGVKEVSVRAAVIWLELGGFIVKCGEIIRRYEGKSYKRKIALWKWTGRLDPISPVRVKEVDQPEREQLNKRYGDGGEELQGIMICMCRKG